MAVLCALVGLATPTGAAEQVEVTLDRERVSVVRGDRFAVQSRITNRGTASTAVKAHLNVASLTGAVSVDPEDWSDGPIQDLPALAPGQSTSLSWEIKAGDVGSFAMYVVLLPAEPSGAPVVSAPVWVSSAGQNTLGAGAVLPVAIAIPVLLGAAAGAAGWRVRRVR